jgi:DNA-binding NtrC family response regulator
MGWYTVDNSPTSILVVDDDVDACRSLADILEDVGYSVDVAHNGPVALELLQKKPFAIALLDLNMPGMDGITLYREIRKLSAATVAIIITAYATGETANSALQAGVWHVLPKPIDFSRLMPLVEQAREQPLIMVVDDDRELCENLWSILRDQEFRVCLAHDLNQVVDQLERGDYKVVLIDMRLPGCNGREIYRTIRERTPDSKTVVITGHRSETSELVDQLLSEGANAVCYKPFDVPQLLKTVERLSQSA